MSKQTLHFTLGYGLGAIIYDIAFEKLVHKNNFNAAIKLYTSSFPGMSVDLAKDIIIGKNMVITNADNLTVSVQRVDPDNKPSYIIDLEELLDRKYETLHTEAIDYLYYKCWRTLQKWRDDNIEIEVTEDNWVSLCNVLGLISQFPETSFKIGVVVSIKVKDLVKSLLSVGTVDKEFVSLLLNYGDDDNWEEIEESLIDFLSDGGTICFKGDPLKTFGCERSIDHPTVATTTKVANVVAIPSIIESSVESQQCVQVNFSISGRKRKLF